ncbi:hypothetical protein WT11_22325 [Burkholderia stagnalis]|nr:hypothetical protein WT11_22325 [Burkholderia stagnalis]
MIGFACADQIKEKTKERFNSSVRLSGECIGSIPQRMRRQIEWRIPIRINIYKIEFYLTLPELKPLAYLHVLIGFQ